MSRVIIILFLIFTVGITFHSISPISSKSVGSEPFLNKIDLPIKIQIAYAQDDDDEEEDNNDEEDENNEEDEDNGNNDEDSHEDDANLIKLCCSWNEEIDDLELSYNIIRHNGDDDDEEDEDFIDESQDVLETAVHEAAKEWNSRLPLKLVEVSDEEEDDADIDVEFVDEGHSMVAGLTITYTDGYGFLNRAVINLPIVSLYTESISNTHAVQFGLQKLKEIAIHEFGHALGLGHANFNEDIMAERVSSQTMSISDCDVEAVLQANQWKLVDDSGPNNLQEDEVYC